MTLSAETLRSVEEGGDLEDYLAMVATWSTEVAIDEVSEVSRNLDGSVTFHVVGEYMGSEYDYLEIDEDGDGSGSPDGPPSTDAVRGSDAVVEMGSSGLSGGMDAPVGSIDATGLQRMVAAGDGSGAPDGGDDGYSVDTGLIGETHRVAGHQVPVGMTEADLVAIGRRPVLDENGDDPTDGEGVPPLPAGDVAAFVEYATRHNNDNGPVVSDEALRRAIDVERLIRADNIGLAQSALRQMEERVASGQLDAAQRRQMELRARNLRREIAQAANWGLWAVSSGEALDLVGETDAHGRDVMVIDGTSYALTSRFASEIGTTDASVPMWDIMVELEQWDPYDYADFIEEMTYDILLADGKIYDMDEPGRRG